MLPLPQPASLLPTSSLSVQRHPRTTHTRPKSTPNSLASPIPTSRTPKPRAHRSTRHTLLPTQPLLTLQRHLKEVPSQATAAAQDPAA